MEDCAVLDALLAPSRLAAGVCVCVTRSFCVSLLLGFVGYAATAAEYVEESSFPLSLLWADSLLKGCVTEEVGGFCKARTEEEELCILLNWVQCDTP